MADYEGVEMGEAEAPGPGPGSSAREEAPDRGAIADWLAGAHPVPRQAQAEWAHHAVALLPLGARFDAIRVPARRIHGALGSDDPRTVGAALLDRLHGPFVRDVRTGSGLYYVLIHPDAMWEGPEHRLGKGIHLPVPRIGQQVSPVTYWAVEPQRRGHLCDPAHLAALLSTGETLKAIER